MAATRRLIAAGAMAGSVKSMTSRSSRPQCGGTVMLPAGASSWRWRRWAAAVAAAAGPVVLLMSRCCARWPRPAAAAA